MFNGNNSILIGADTKLTQSSNQVVIGNNHITSARIQVPWTHTSDARLKSSITPLPYGYDFLAQLNPVKYIRTGSDSQKYEYGFLAQDIVKIFESQQDTEQGMLTQDHNGYYELRYNDLFAIIVRAIQDIGSQRHALNERIQSLENENAELRARLDAIEARLSAHP